MIGSLLAKLRLVWDHCTVCGGNLGSSPQGYLCSSCLSGIKPVPTSRREPLPYVSAYRVYAPYEGVLAEAIRLIKFRGVRPLARLLGERIGRDLRSFREEVFADVITFVPVHPFRYWGRGFDHNREILRGTDLRWEEILVRTKHTKPLARYGKEERFRKVESAFSPAKGERVEGKRVLVFDDVLTTGATAVSVSRTLLLHGADAVFFYFLSREG